MSTWGAVKSPGTTPLYRATESLPKNVRQAMYGAAKKSLIARKTWNGCAFNAASGNASVSSVGSAAVHFDVQPSLVRHFIDVWDSLPGTDAQATQTLIHTIEQVGLFEDQPRTPIKKVTARIFTSRETKLLEELQKTIDAVEVDEESGVILSISEYADDMEKALCLVNS